MPLLSKASWMPVMNSKKKRSEELVTRGRCKTKPIALEHEEESARAVAFGRHPILAAISIILARVVGETPGRSLRANDTAARETPASRAISRIVGRAIATPSLVVIGLLQVYLVLNRISCYSERSASK